MQAKRSKADSRGYQIVSDEKRKALIKFITVDKMKIVDAAEMIDIPYENAKAIYRIYKNEGRSQKKIFKKREKDYDQFMKMHKLAAERYRQLKKE